MTLSDNHITTGYAGISLQTVLTGGNIVPQGFTLAGKYA